MAGEDKRFKVIVSDGATEMLVFHARFLAQVREKAAMRLITEFEKQARTLEHIPECCSWLSDAMIPAGKYRKLIFEKHYLLIFKIKDTTVYVDAVLDCRQDYGWLL